jgi:hypothetical protein
MRKSLAVCFAVGMLVGAVQAIPLTAIPYGTGDDIVTLVYHPSNGDFWVNHPIDEPGANATSAGKMTDLDINSTVDFFTGPKPTYFSGLFDLYTSKKAFRMSSGDGFTSRMWGPGSVPSGLSATKVSGALAATASYSGGDPLINVDLYVVPESAGTVIIDNGTYVNTLPGLQSELVGQQIADDFIIINFNRIINDAHWWGAYQRMAPAPAEDNFTLRFFGDDGGKPTVLPTYEVVVGNDVNRTDTLVDVAVGAPNILGADIFAYSAKFPPFRIDSEGKYWLSIVNDTSDTPANWTWSQTNTGVGTAFGMAEISWSASPEENMAFNLTRELPPCGDFIMDGLLDKLDVNALIKKLGSVDPAFDLNSDGLVNSSDLDYWVNICKKTCYGDANLDGEFKSSDLVLVFQSGKCETGTSAGWEEGDWDGDGFFTSADFVRSFERGCYETGPRACLGAVPEPTSGFLLLLSLGALTYSGRIRRTKANAH